MSAFSSAIIRRYRSELLLWQACALCESSPSLQPSVAALDVDGWPYDGISIFSCSTSFIPLNLTPSAQHTAATREPSLWTSWFYDSCATPSHTRVSFSALAPSRRTKTWTDWTRSKLTWDAIMKPLPHRCKSLSTKKCITNFARPASYQFYNPKNTLMRPPSGDSRPCRSLRVTRIDFRFWSEVKQCCENFATVAPKVP